MSERNINRPKSSSTYEIDDLIRLVERSSEGICVINKQGEYLYINQKASEILGYPKEEILQSNISRFLLKEEYQQRQDQLIDRIEDKNFSPYTESRIIRKDGSSIWIGIFGYRSTWQGESVVISFFHDITKAKRHELWAINKNILLNESRYIEKPHEYLDFACKMIENAGLYQRSVITIHDDQKRILEHGSYGLDPELIDQAINSSAPDAETSRQMTAEEFCISNSYFIPVEADLKLDQLERYIPLDEHRPDPYCAEPWQKGDEFFIPLYSEANKIEGYISVDSPCNGERPDIDTVYFMEDLAGIISRKIHDLRRIKALAESEQMYRSITEQSLLPICIRQQGRFVYCNEAFSLLFGYPVEQILSWSGQDILDNIDLREKEISRDKYDEISKDYETLSVIRAKTSEGKRIWLERFSKQLKDPETGDLSELIILIDRSKEKEMEQLLINDKKKSQALIEASEDCILLVDSRGTILDLNQNYAKLFNKSRSDLINTSIWLNFPAAVSKLRKAKLSEVVKSGISLVYEERESGKWFRTNVYPIPNGQKIISRIAVFARDITQEKKLMQQLLNTEKLAAVGRLAAGVAHQIRNPLGNINFAAQLCLRSPELPANLQEYLNLIIEDVGNTNNIITNLLKYSEPREINLENTDLKSVIRDACKLLKPALKDKSIALSIDLPSPLPRIKLDTKWMSQVLLNLLNNSIQAIGTEGSIEISVKNLEPEQVLQITVKDSGPGIEEVILEKIFEPFFTTKETGIGLGLNIVHKIIKSHLGTIEVESEPGKYTLFTIKLPLEKKESFNNFYRLPI